MMVNDAFEWLKTSFPDAALATNSVLVSLEPRFAVMSATLTLAASDEPMRVSGCGAASGVEFVRDAENKAIERVAEFMGYSPENAKRDARNRFMKHALESSVSEETLRSKDSFLGLRTFLQPDMEVPIKEMTAADWNELTLCLMAVSTPKPAQETAEEAQ